jgi:DNA polymerase
MAARRSDELHVLAEDAGACRRCDLWRDATQVVFGAGPPAARIALVGEQPGDHEDRAGAPFVGPAGRELDRALADAGIDRTRVYLTNAVKHFKWKPRGKRRIHERPNRTEVVACSAWLRAELAVVEPSVIVALGATAGQSLFGGSFRVGSARGTELDLDGIAVVAAIHPSAILRATAGPDRDAAYDSLVVDLRRAADIAGR